MRSRHKKQRVWIKRIGDKWQELESEIEKLKGATPASVHPSRIQTLTPYEKDKGATLGTLSNIWPSVNWQSTLS